MFRFFPVMAIAFGLFVLPEPSAAANPARPEAWLDAFARARGLDGVVLVSQGDQVLVHRAFGLANREWGVPNSPDTRFHIASVTKPITAAAVLALVERGRVRLDDTVSDHVPWYHKDTGERVTVHHLLSHTSGFPN